MAGGRPTKYSDDILVQANDYLINYESDSYNDVFPSVVGLACVLKLSKSTLYEWAKHSDKVEFSDTLGQINALQDKILLTKGLLGDFNAAITKLVLTNHGYSDKLEQDITTGGEKLQNNFIIQAVKPN